MIRYKLLGIILFLSTGAFGQPVEELILMAKEYSPTLKALKLEYEASLSKADQVRDWPDPKVNFAIGVLPIETRLGAQRFKLGVSQSIPWKGTLQAHSQLANTMAEIKSYDDDVKEIDLAYRIREAYSSLQYLNAKRQVFDERLRVLAVMEELAKVAVKSGRGKVSHALLVERKKTEIAADYQLLDQLMELPTILINRYTGRPLDTKVIVDDSNELMTNTEELIDFAEHMHPELLRLEQKKNASEVKEALIQYNTKPKLSIGLDYAYIDARDGVEIEHNGRDVLMPKGSISIPLHKGKFAAIRQEEKLIRESLDRRYEEIRDRNIAEIQTAYTRLEYESEVHKKYQSLKIITQETLELMRTEYASEGTRFEELLRIEMELIDFELEILKSKYNQRLAKAILKKYN